MSAVNTRRPTTCPFLGQHLEDLMIRKILFFALMLACLWAGTASALELPHSYLDIRVEQGDSLMVRISHVMVDSFSVGNVYSRGGSNDGPSGIERAQNYVDSFSEWQYPYTVGMADPTGWNNYDIKEWDRLDRSLAKARAQNVRDHIGGLLANEVETQTVRGFQIYRIEIRTEDVCPITAVVQPARVDTLHIIEQHFKMDTSWALGFFGGLSNSRDNFNCLGTANLFYENTIMIGAYGLNSLFLNSKHEFRGENLSTYDSGYAIMVGARLWNLFWVSASGFSQANVLDQGSEAGRTPDWFKGQELGVFYIQQHFMVSLSYLSGDRKQDEMELYNDSYVRLGVSIGNVWGW